MDLTSAVDAFREIVDDPRQAADQSGRKVVGYFCAYLPPELLLAAGLHPFRFRGVLAEDSATGDAYLSHLNCSYARHVTAAAIDGAYDFLAGQISCNACDHVRRANDAIIAKSDLPFHAYFSIPRSFRPDLLPYYREELERLIKALEDRFGVKVTDDGLAEAAAQMNQVRDRLDRIDRLRRGDAPSLSGADALQAQIAARMLLPQKFLKLADDLIAAAEHAPPRAGVRARLVLIGGELDEPRFVSALESQGAQIAADLLCFGARGLGQKVEPGRPPLEAIARAYLHQVPCARMIGEFPRRYAELRRLVHESGAKGVVFQRIKFCQIWSTEVHGLRHRFQTEPIPLLVLDREYGTVNVGQIKTRVQAFLERLGV